MLKAPFPWFGGKSRAADLIWSRLGTDCGENPALRIALCGHDTEHNELEAMGWSVETWDKPSGYQGADDRERIWFSPHCIGSREPTQLAMF